MKRWLSAITAILLSMTFMGLPTRAADKEFKVNDSLGKNELKFVPDEINVKFRNDKNPFRTIKVAAGSVKDEVAKYSKQANVEYAEPNYIAQAYMVPNDPYYSYQWNFKEKAQGGIELEQAWEKRRAAMSLSRSWTRALPTKTTETITELRTSPTPNLCRDMTSSTMTLMPMMITVMERMWPERWPKVPTTPLVLPAQHSESHECR